MKECLHKKFGSIVLSNTSNEQVHWCRNCGTLRIAKDGTFQEVKPQVLTERATAR